MAESAILPIAGRLASLLRDEATFLLGVRQQVDQLKTELTLMQGYLCGADTMLREGRNTGGVRVWFILLRDLCYEAENIIEDADYLARRNRIKRGFMGAISRYARLPCDAVHLHMVGNEISTIRNKIRELRETAITTYQIDNLTRRLEDPNGGNRTASDYQHYSDPTLDSDIVGLDKESAKIESELTSGDSSNNGGDLRIISIVAMGGAGKTTLAKKVYASVTAGTHFAASAFVAVSPSYSIVNLLKNIMWQTMHLSSRELDNMVDEGEIRRRLKKFLKKKRFLIVFDDLWPDNPWDQIKNIFLHEIPTGSRIILTTRSLVVGNQIDKKTDIHQLQPLASEQSWDLFYKKAFPSYRTLPDKDKDELVPIGTELVKKCKGLPLAIVVLGGYLSKNLKRCIWERMRDSFHWEDTIKEGNVHEILARSYHDLAQPGLKACFLSIAAFPENYDISASDLTRIWISECFVPHDERRRADEIAKIYMEELGQRFMVQVVSRSKLYGWIEKIRMHDVLRDWCLKQASEDGFLKWCCGQDNHVGYHRDQRLVFYRVAAEQSFDYRDNEMYNYLQKVRSLLCFRLNNLSLSRFKYLRALYLQELAVTNFARDVNQLIHLRYLCLRRCRGIELPQTIGQNLLQLGTIDLSETAISSIPSSLWAITKLNYVYLGVVDTFMPTSFSRRRRPRLEKFVMKTFNHVDDYTWGRVAALLANMTQLIALEIHGQNMNIEVMKNLHNHESLRQVDLKTMKIPRPTTTTDSAALSVPNLVQLTLRISCEYEDATADLMQKLKLFPKLEELSLEEVEGHGSSNLACPSDGFLMLRRLVLQSTISDLTFQERGMPNATHLKLFGCTQLRSIRGLAHLVRLERLELEGMPDLPHETYAAVNRDIVSIR